MAQPLFPHFGPVLQGGIVFDRAGIGATRRAEGCAAAWVLMRPSIFLALATPLHEPRASLGWLRQQMLAGADICPAELRLRRVPQAAAAISAHEGRHRMTVLRELLGDVPVPVRLAIPGLDWNAMDALLLGHLRNGLKAQRRAAVIPGPLFEEAEPDLGGLPPSGIPPPSSMAHHSAREFPPLARIVFREFPRLCRDVSGNCPEMVQDLQAPSDTAFTPRWSLPTPPPPVLKGGWLMGILGAFVQGEMFDGARLPPHY